MRIRNKKIPRGLVLEGRAEPCDKRIIHHRRLSIFRLHQISCWAGVRRRRVAENGDRATQGQTVKRILSRAMLLLCVLSIALCASGQSVGIWDAASEQEMLRLLNQERTRRGLRPLQMEPQLVTVARRHSQRMAEQGALSHQFRGEPDLNARLAPTDMHFNASGENVAVNTSAADAHKASDGFAASPREHSEPEVQHRLESACCAPGSRSG